MKALALFGVLALAKIIALAGYTIPLSVWTPVAYLWQDATVALLFAALDGALGQAAKRSGWTGWARASWVIYAAIVAYAAINVSVVRVLASPITWPMMRAARGALSDSILHHATPGNLLAVALVAGAGLGLPYILGRATPLRRRPLIATLICAAVLFILIGPTASARVETVGLDRNAVFTLVAAAMRPRFDADRVDAYHRRAIEDRAAEDWRASPFEETAAEEDLSSLRGAAKGRNVVLIVLESAGARYLKPYGAANDPMPNLTKLAARGILFERAYTVFPESIKTLYSILCARAPALDTPAERYADVRPPAIAATLKTSGYRTGLFHSGRFGYLGMEEVIEGRGFDTLEDAGAIGGERESSFGVDEPSTVDRMLAWIDEGKNDRPFFVTYLPIAGHHPYDTPAPGPFPDREDADRYLNALHYADEAMGRLMAGLRARALEEKTLFVVFGDHGEAFGQHEGNYGHSLFLYEENVHVPYLIAAPGLWSEQQRLKKAVSLMDTAPTILDLLGMGTPEGFEGRSMLEAGRRMALFATDYSLALLGLRDGCWKFIDEVESGRGKLYDLCADPDERRDLSSAESVRVSKYRERLRRWSKENAEIAE